MNGTDALLALLTAFDRAEIPYMVVGSYSSNYYGLPRSTKDADLVVRLSQEDWWKLPLILPQGMKMEDQSSFELVTSTKREIIRIEGTPFQIEVFQLSDDEHDRVRFERRQQVEIFPTCSVFLPTAEDVIIQKLRWSHRAKRPKDFADVISILKVQGKDRLDWRYTEEWCVQHHTLDLLNEAKSEASLVWDK